jgi:hypothetical protein
MMAEPDFEKMTLDAIRDGIRKGVSEKFTGYNSPLDDLVKKCLEKFNPQIRSMLEDSIASCIGDAEFREDIAKAVRHKLASTLIQRFGGEMEKQVNVLKSDPTTRARITLAIEEIVKQKT